jgi:hypothetical protein
MILHRDLSKGNIMHMYRNGEDYFVLIDFDLAVRVGQDGQPLGPTSRHRTGTLPFMAFDLVNDMYLAENAEGPRSNAIVHCVRHDYESVFWVSLWCAVEIVKEGIEDSKTQRHKRMEYLAEWESGTYKQIANTKNRVLVEPSATRDVPLSPSFEHLRNWLKSLHGVFWDGRMRQIQAEHKNTKRNKVTFEQFETWHGAITRETLEEAMRDVDANYHDTDDEVV